VFGDEGKSLEEPLSVAPQLALPSKLLKKETSLNKKQLLDALKKRKSTDRPSFKIALEFGRKRTNSDSFKMHRPTKEVKEPCIEEEKKEPCIEEEKKQENHSSFESSESSDVDGYE